MGSPFWHGKSVLITWASSGIGRALALELAGHGARLALAARRSDRLEELAGTITGNGGQAAAFCLDVADPDSIQQVVPLVVEHWGSIDVVIANAGRGGMIHPHAVDVQDIHNLFKVNTLGAIGVAAAALPYMMRQGSGHLAVVSSLVAWLPQPFSIGYGSTKAAVSYFFESWRPALRGRGIKVTVIYPGFVHTEMTAHKRYPMPMAMTAGTAARRIRRGLERGQGRIVFPRRAAAALVLARMLPLGLRDRIWRRWQGRMDVAHD